MDNSLLTLYYSNNEAIVYIFQNYIITIIFWSRNYKKLDTNLEEHETFAGAALLSVFLN